MKIEDAFIGQIIQYKGENKPLGYIEGLSTNNNHEVIAKIQTPDNKEKPFGTIIQLHFGNIEPLK